MAGELDARVIEGLLQDLARGGIDRPALEAGGTVVGAEPIPVEDLRVAHDVDHDLARRGLEGVQWVEHVAEPDVEPTHRVGLTVAGQQAHAGAVVRVPGVRELGPGHRRVEVEGHREVEEDHVVLGDGAVVDHRPPLDGHPDLAPQATVGTDDRVAEVVPGPEVADRVQLPGVWIPLGVGGVALLDRSVETVHRHRLQLIGQLDREEPRLDDRPGPAGVADDVGVRGEAPVAPYPAVPVPLGPPVPQPQAMHHALPGEPVVRLGTLDREVWVGAVPQQAPVEALGDHPGHLEVEGRDLLGHRREVAGEVRVRGHDSPPAGSVDDSF